MRCEVELRAIGHNLHAREHKLACGQRAPRIKTRGSLKFGCRLVQMALAFQQPTQEQMRRWRSRELPRARCESEDRWTALAPLPLLLRDQ